MLGKRSFVRVAGHSGRSRRHFAMTCGYQRGFTPMKSSWARLSLITLSCNS